MREIPIRPLASIVSIAVVLVAACGDDGGGGGDTAATGAMTEAATQAMDDGVDDDGSPTGTPDDGVDDGVDTTAAPDDDGGSTMPPTDDSTGDTGVGEGTGAYRLNSMAIVDPHMYALGGIADITDTVNTAFNDGLNMDLGPDKMPDGFYELGLVLRFNPLDQSDAAAGDVDFANSQCTADGTETCNLLPMTMLYPTSYT